MKREELKALGLTDEQIDKIMGVHGQDINDLKASHKAALDAATAKAKDTETQLADLTGKLTAAQQSAGDAETIRQQLTKAQGDLAAQQKAAAIRAGLSGYKLHDPETVLALLKQDAITIGADGAAIGLKEQMDAMRTGKAFLFSDAPDAAGGGENKGGGDPAKDMNSFIRGL